MADHSFDKYARLLFKHHPWHGLDIGYEAPRIVNAYIEITPTDNVKYEVDKNTGFLKVDRPQAFSSQCPSLYGLIPRTYCGPRVSAYFAKKAGLSKMDGDTDPLDICVLSERPIFKSDILVEAKPIGGLRMIDNGEADDKIIAVLKSDLVYGEWNDISDCPHNLVDRLRHYFLTYKDFPTMQKGQTDIVTTYNREEAHEVIRLSREDYQEKFAELGRFMEKIFPE
ncbi:MAG TPA: inorganic pyrophosphatase [bacterium]|nr:inorganic pyrophosphatase [bacterium]